MNGGQLNGIHEWPSWLAEKELVFLSSLAVERDGRLTVPQGATLHFPFGSVVSIEGSLDVNGTQEFPVLFTSSRLNPTPGTWHGLRFGADSRAEMKHFAVEYAGQKDDETGISAGIIIHSDQVNIESGRIEHTDGDGIYSSVGLKMFDGYISDFATIGLNVAGDLTLGDTRIVSGTSGLSVSGVYTLTNNSLSDVTGYALQVQADSIGPSKLSGNMFSGGINNAIKVEGGMLDGEHHWPTWIADHEIHLTSGLEVNQGGMLTLSPGTNLHFPFAGSLRVHGKLVGKGTAENPIIFTANRDGPTVGFWRGLNFAPKSEVKLEHFRVEYAGRPDEDTGIRTAVLIESSDVDLLGAEIKHTRGDGIYSLTDFVLKESHIYSNTQVGIRSLGSLIVSDTVIEGGTHGIIADDTYTLTNNSVVGASEYGLRLVSEAIGVGGFKNNTISGGAIEVAGGQIEGTIQWPAWLASYEIHLTSPLEVSQGSSLSLPTGLHLHFPFASAFVIKGKLDGRGTPEQPIVFTVNTNEPKSGFWQGLIFESGSDVKLAHFRVEYAGRTNDVKGIQSALVVESEKVDLEHAEIRYTRGHGVLTLVPFSLRESHIYSHTDAGILAVGPLTVSDTAIEGGTHGIIAHSDYALTNNHVTGASEYSLVIAAEAIGKGKFENNIVNGGTVEAIRIAGGQIKGDVIWPDWLTSYAIHLVSSLEVEQGSSLQLPPGLRIYFPFGGVLDVRGKLQGKGTSDQPIVFTARRDVPRHGSWYGLNLAEGSELVLENFVIEYAGRKNQETGRAAAIAVDKAVGRLTKGIIRKNAGDHIYVVDSSDFSITESQIYEGWNCAIINQSSDSPVQATNVWWGTSKGPPHPILNPGGDGQGVSDGVNFHPWMTAEPDNFEPGQNPMPDLSMYPVRIYSPILLKRFKSRCS